MTSFGLIRTLVCVYVVFLLGAAGRNFGIGSPFTLPVASIPSTTITALTYAQVHVAGYARSFPTQIEPQLSTTTSIVTDTDSLDSSRPVATALADHPTGGGITRPEEDASSKIQAIFFGIAGTCIGVATLIVGVLALRKMPERGRLEDSESQSLECNHRPAIQHGDPASQDAPVELDAVETAVEMQCEQAAIRNSSVQATRQLSGTTVEMQCEQSAIRNFNVQATRQLSGTTAVTG